MKLRSNTLIALAFLALLLFLSVSCTRTDRQSPSPSGTPGDNAGKIQVITTILPIYDIAKNVGGDRVTVRNLLPPGSSPHTYEPTTEDSRAIENADIIFKLGLGLDDWMDRILSATGGKKNVVVVSKNVPTLSFGEEQNPFGTPEAGEEHEASSPDPHVWMDPMRMKIMAQNVRDALVALKPEDRQVFEKNYEAYAKQMDELDKEYRETLAPFEKKNFITVHSFLQYQTERYGITQTASIADFPGKEPDPNHIIKVIKLLKEQNVKVVFVEPQFSPKAADAIAQEIGGQVVMVDPLGSLGDPERDTYVKNMRKNLASLKEAFEKENQK